MQGDAKEVEHGNPGSTAAGQGKGEMPRSRLQASVHRGLVNGTAQTLFGWHVFLGYYQETSYGDSLDVASGKQLAA